MRATLLLTSAGSLVAFAILRGLEGARGDLTIVGANSVAAPIAFACDRLYRVPPTADAPAHEAALRDVLAREKPRLVLPGRDEDVAVLAVLAASGDFPETAFPVPPPALAPVFLDKRRTHRFARDHGLPFAPTAADADEAAALARTHGYPMLAKPWSGAGSRGVLLPRDAAELAAAAGDGTLMVQAFLGGAPADASRTADGMPWRFELEDEETTIEMTIGPDGVISSLCLDSGTTAPPLRKGVRLIEDEAARAVGLAWGRALAAHGHRGVVNIQGKRLADGRFVPWEIAARFGGTAAARAALGRNQVLHLVREWLGLPTPAMTSRPGAVWPETRRVTVPRAWTRRFASEGKWSAPRTGLRAAAMVVEPAPDGLATAIDGDRLAVAAYARRHGLPFLTTAATVDEAAALIRTAGPPLVGKPRRGDGPARLLEDWPAVAAALEAGAMVAQPLLGADEIAGRRRAWTARAGTPLFWAVEDTVETAEAEVAPDGRLSPVRTALCAQRGGRPIEIRPTRDPAVAAIFRRWAATLIRDGRRGPLRLTGKRDADGVWRPFSLAFRPLGIPAGGAVAYRLTVMASAPRA